MKTRPLASIAAVVLMLASTCAVAEAVVLITDRAHPFTDTAGHPVIYLDEVERIERELSVGIDAFVTSGDVTPQQLEAVQRHVKQNLAGHDILGAYADLSMAWSLGVTHIPAVVSDGKVVYGVADASQALDILQRK